MLHIFRRYTCKNFNIHIHTHTYIYIFFYLYTQYTYYIRVSLSILYVICVCLSLYIIICIICSGSTLAEHAVHHLSHRSLRWPVPMDSIWWPVPKGLDERGRNTCSVVKVAMLVGSKTWTPGEFYKWMDVRMIRMIHACRMSAAQALSVCIHAGGSPRVSFSLCFGQG